MNRERILSTNNSQNQIIHRLFIAAYATLLKNNDAVIIIFNNISKIRTILNHNHQTHCNSGSDILIQTTSKWYSNFVELINLNLKPKS